MTIVLFFLVAIIYLGTLILSVAYWIFDTLRKKAMNALSGGNNANSPSSPSAKKRYGGKSGNYGAVSTK